MVLKINTTFQILLNIYKIVVLILEWFKENILLKTLPFNILCNNCF